jgi:hypothetical protein
MSDHLTGELREDHPLRRYRSGSPVARKPELAIAVSYP